MKWIDRILSGRKRSIRFYKYFLSYVLIVITLLAVIGSVVYSNFIGTLRHEVESANIASLRQIRDTVDMRIKELQRIAVQISKNPQLTPYMLTHAGYETYQAVAELNKYRTSNSFIYNVGIAFSHADDRNFYTADGVYERELFFKRIFQYSAWNEAEFMRTIGEVSRPLIRPTEDVLLSGVTPARFATYLYPLPAHSGKPYGSVVFILNEQTFSDMAAALLNGGNGVFFLLDERREPIFTLNNGETEARAQEMQRLVRAGAPAETINALRVGGTAYSAVRLPSGYNEWSYVTFIPEQQFMRPVETSRQIAAVTLAAILLLGLWMSFSLADQNYRKLRELVHIFRDRKGPGDAETIGGAVDEIAYLSDALRETARQESVRVKLNSRTGLLREKLLLSLVQGKTGKLEELDNLIELSGIRLEHPRYIALLLVIDDYRRFQRAHAASMQDLFKFSIINVAEELAGEIGRGYGIDLAEGRGVAIVVNVPELTHERHAFREMALKIQMFFKTYYKFTLSIGVGTSRDSLEGIRASFVEAERALYYRFVKGGEQVLFFEELRQEQGSPDIRYSYPLELEEQLVKSIRQGKPDEAERAVRGMLGCIASMSATPESAQAACTGLLHTLVRAVGELDAAVEPRWRTALEGMMTEPRETIAQLERELVELCRDVCESMSDRKESRNFELRDSILAFVETHYADSTLTLEQIAARFGMSPSYITRFIKDQTGYSLIRYLDQLRLQKTKELLRTTSITMSEVAERVGYVDLSNFIRKFKKTEGVTPAQYRMLYQKPASDGPEKANS